MNALNSSFNKNSSYINRQWQSRNGETFEVTNPANGEVICTLNSADKNDALMAVDAAIEAMPAWRAKTAKQRSAILRRWFELIMQNPLYYD